MLIGALLAQAPSKHASIQGLSYLSEVGARGLLRLGKKHLDHQNWKKLMQSKKIRPPF